MFDFIVLISRHMMYEHRTKQLSVLVGADDIPGARSVARFFYPSTYLRIYEQGRYIGKGAYFTGDIWQV